MIKALIALLVYGECHAAIQAHLDEAISGIIHTQPERTTTIPNHT